mmetsp:Transcript_13915/g.35539  ORF Transcript_13915/g.35539 Transcript_13915/m.35539 type:complete len:271 (+) Transcript_13915:143-955(+)
MYNGPPRGGVRGGRDQFNWDDVKTNKYKENYLGNSLHATRPTFQTRKPNAGWYLKKDGGSSDSRADELALIKQQEDLAMRQALGLAPRTTVVTTQQLDKTEIELLTKKGESAVELSEADRVNGLGFGSSIKNIPGHIAPSTLEAPKVSIPPTPSRQVSCEEEARGSKSGRDGEEAGDKRKEKHRDKERKHKDRHKHKDKDRHRHRHKHHKHRDRDREHKDNDKASKDLREHKHRHREKDQGGTAWEEGAGRKRTREEGSGSSSPKMRRRS